MALKISRKKPASEVSTASTADIAFLLIVFFMVTTVIAATKGIEFKLPKEEKNPQQQQVKKLEAVHIKLFQSGGFTVDKNPMNIPSMKQYVQQKLESSNYNKFIIIQCEDNVPYGNLIEILDILYGMKAKNIAIPTKREIEEWGVL